MPEADSLSIPRDVELFRVQAAQHDRDVMDLADNLQDEFGPVTNNIERCICVVEHWDVQDATILIDELVQADPLILINMPIDLVDVLVANTETHALLKSADAPKDVSTGFVILSVVVLFKSHTHHVPVQLHL